MKKHEKYRIVVLQNTVDSSRSLDWAERKAKEISRTVSPVYVVFDGQIVSKCVDGKVIEDTA